MWRGQNVYMDGEGGMDGIRGGDVGGGRERAMRVWFSNFYHEGPFATTAQFTCRRTTV